MPQAGDKRTLLLTLHDAMGALMSFARPEERLPLRLLADAQACAETMQMVGLLPRIVHARTSVDERP